ncbi:MAG: hypothetical protein ABFD69_07350 [Candidatus Sumerlaeia bacterium]
MSHYVLYAAQSESSRDIPWPLDLASRGVVVMTARNHAQAIPYCRAYPLLALIVEIDTLDDAWREGFSRIRQAVPAENRPSLIGLLRGDLDAAGRAALSAEGLDGLVSASDPESFIVNQIETLTRLAELRQFEQTRMDVSQLANRTREQLHELSQPLSAIQGRLQLLAAVCPETDPSHKNLKELVQLSFKVSSHLAEMQQLHRKFS